MNTFQKIFENKIKKPARTITLPDQEYIDEIQKKTNALWQFIDEALEFYNLTSCQCAFPRYRQIANINMSELNGSFYVSETEGFISISKKYFDTLKLDEGEELNNQLWICKKCGSTYIFGWSDFSINVNRQFLKLNELKVSDLGSAIETPIPLFVGAIGHKYPGEDTFKMVTLNEFKTYMLT